MALSKIKSRLKRQETWSGVALIALALVPVFPPAAIYLTALAGVSGGVKLILSTEGGGKTEQAEGHGEQ